MISERTFLIVGLTWFFGWSFLSLKFPSGSFRVLAWGRKPTGKQLKVVRFVGYMALVGGALLVVEIALGLVPAW